MKKRILIYIIIACVVLVGCSIDNKILKIEKLIEDGNYDRAESRIEKLLENNKDNKKLYDMYLTIYDKKDKDLEKVLVEGIKRFDDLEYKKILKEDYIKKEELEKAAIVLEDIIKDDKGIENYIEIIDIYLENEDYNKAIKLFERDKEYIDDEKTLLEMALVYIEKRNELKARDIVESINEDKLKDIEELELLAEYYFRINDDSNSYRVVRKGLTSYSGETILFGFNYGFMNSDGLKMIDIFSKDINGDGYKENIILLSGKKDTLNSSNVILTVQDSSNGDILGKKRLTGYLGYKNIEFEDFNKDDICDIYIETYTREDIYGKPEIYTFNNNNFKNLTEDYSYNDVEYRLGDGFILEIYSENQNKKYILDLEKDKNDLVDMGIFNKEGKPLEGAILELSNSEYKSTYIEKLKQYGVKEVFELGGSDKTFANIELVYLYKDGIMEVCSFDIKSSYGMKIEKHNGEKVSLIENIDIDELEKMLKMNKKDIYKSYGKPSKTDYLQLERLDYNGVQFFMRNSDEVDSIRILNINDIMKIKIPASYTDIVNKMGEPLEESRGEEYVDEYELIYKEKGINLRFTGNRGVEDSFILYISKD